MPMVRFVVGTRLGVGVVEHRWTLWLGRGDGPVGTRAKPE